MNREGRKNQGPPAYGGLAGLLRGREGPWVKPDAKSWLVHAYAHEQVDAPPSFGDLIGSSMPEAKHAHWDKQTKILDTHRRGPSIPEMGRSFVSEY